MAEIETENFKQIDIAGAEDLWDWLSQNHEQQQSVWLVLYKKHMGDKYTSVGEVLDALVAYGWIDGIRRKLDDDRTMQLVSPRQTLAWAKSYKERAEKLIAEKRMQEPGLNSIKISKQNGMWDYWADVDALICPDDLIAALEKVPSAKHNFDEGAPSYRRNLLRFVKLAKTEPTRIKRIEKIVSFAARNEKMPQM